MNSPSWQSDAISENPYLQLRQTEHWMRSLQNPEHKIQ